MGNAAQAAIKKAAPVAPVYSRVGVASNVSFGYTQVLLLTEENIMSILMNM
jgi:hypothetical protein